MLSHTDRQRRLFWWGWALPVLLVVITLYFLTGGCATNPLSVAQTPLQKGYALYGEFVIFEEQAAALKQSGSVPPSLIRDLQAEDAVTKPIADALLKAIQDAEASGVNNTSTLTRAIAIATDAIAHFATTVKATQP